MLSILPRFNDHALLRRYWNVPTNHMSHPSVQYRILVPSTYSIDPLMSTVRFCSMKITYTYFVYVGKYCPDSFFPFDFLFVNPIEYVCPMCSIEIGHVPAVSSRLHLCRIYLIVKHSFIMSIVSVIPRLSSYLCSKSNKNSLSKMIPWIELIPMIQTNEEWSSAILLSIMIQWILDHSMREEPLFTIILLRRNSLSPAHRHSLLIKQIGTNSLVLLEIQRNAMSSIE